MERYLSWFTDPGNWTGSNGIPTRLIEHLQYSAVATLIAIAIAVPLGLWIGHTNRGALAVINIGNLGRALPDLGIIITVAVVIGFTIVPVLVALVGLAIAPLLTNVYTGVRQVDEDVRDAAYGIGLTGWQVLWRVEVPMALPLIFTGIRIATVQVIATATLAAFIGRLGGLGRYIFDGFALGQTPRAVGGAVLVALLALLVEGVLALTQRATVSPGVARRDGGGGRRRPRSAASQPATGDAA